MQVQTATCVAVGVSLAFRLCAACLQRTPVQLPALSTCKQPVRTHAGKLLPELDAWDALRAALPVGTISGAPKVRAMQIIDELEVNRRGPYGGGYGYVSFGGAMDMALALRTMVIPTDATEALHDHGHRRGGGARREWRVHLQAGAGIVADSLPESEFQETVSKSNALSRAIDLAESAFLTPDEKACST
jgi:anthranilate synthase component I